MSPCLSARCAPSSIAKTPWLLARAAGKGKNTGWSTDPAVSGCGTRVHPPTESLELLISPGVQAEPGWHGRHPTGFPPWVPTCATTAEHSATAVLPIRHPKRLQGGEISAGVHRQGAPRRFFPLGSRRVFGFFEDECDCKASQCCWQHQRAPRDVQREVKQQLRCSRRNRNPNTGHRRSPFHVFQRNKDVKVRRAPGEPLFQLPENLCCSSQQSITSAEDEAAH